MHRWGCPGKAAEAVDVTVCRAIRCGVRHRKRLALKIVGFYCRRDVPAGADGNRFAGGESVGIMAVQFCRTRQLVRRGRVAAWKEHPFDTGSIYKEKESSQAGLHGPHVRCVIATRSSRLVS